MNILLVEDSATLRYAMSRYITDAGHTPIFAENGEKAMQVVESSTVDMIIMDVEMPGLNGFETTRLLREILKDDWIPIIFVTGKSDEEDLEQGINAGGDDYLIKPVSQVILQAKIRAMQRLIDMRKELQHLNHELRELSEHDGLTKLYNRRTFDEKASEQWQHATQSHTALSVLILDIDHFKAYNDCYGHLAGDACIQAVSDAIARCVKRPEDILARYGGEEFIALLPNTNEKGAQHIAEQIRKTIADLNIKHAASPSKPYITVSVGGAVIDYTVDTQLLELINAADKALYQSKQNGRNQVTVKNFSPCSTVLVVSEDEHTIGVINRELDDQCHTIQTASGKEAFELVALKHPDIIIIDQLLSDMTALTLGQRLRNQEDTKDLPIVIIGDQTPGNIMPQLMSKLHISEYLRAPINEDKLIDKISQYLK